MNKIDTKNHNSQKSPVKITVNGEWCKRCGICVIFCPKGVFVSDDFEMVMVKHPERCIKCMLCVVRCPDFAVDVEKE